MSEQEAQSQSQMAQMKPYLIAAGALIIILLVAFLWPDSDAEQPLTSAPIAVTPALPVMDETAGADGSENRLPQPDVFQGTPEIKSLEIEVGEDIEPLPDLVVIEPIDESDGAVKNAFITMATSPLVGKYLINEGLLQKFVINVNSIANHEMSPNHSLITVPDEDFRVYQQADRDWIDAASFKRYNTYVDALESMSTDDLITLMNTYRDILESKFAEIAPPDSSFNSTLLQAIDELLNTPIIPLPIEVYSDSVMFKFKDEQIEALSGPQKQLIRTGPGNTRRIKDILRDLQDALQE